MDSPVWECLVGAPDPVLAQTPVTCSGSASHSSGNHLPLRQEDPMASNVGIGSRVWGSEQLTASAISESRFGVC